MTPTMLQTSAALCFAVAILLQLMSVWFKFRYIARWIVCIPTVGAVLHSAWIFDVLIRNRIHSTPPEAIKIGELAGLIWVGLGIAFSALAFLYTEQHGDAETHGEPSTCRAFESEKTRERRATQELRGSGHAIVARR